MHVPKVQSAWYVCVHMCVRAGANFYAQLGLDVRTIRPEYEKVTKNQRSQKLLG